MTRSELLALAARVDVATGADRMIDEAISPALGWLAPKPPLRSWRTPQGYRASDGVPRYTASLDAALTLVPEGWDWAVTKGFGESALAAASPANSVATVETQAATPALALTAAALRARAEEAPHE